MFISKVEKASLKADVDFLRKVIKELQIRFGVMECNIQELNLKRPIVIKTEKSTQKPVIAKKRGRPVGSKANRPKFPPKTPFELKKPLGRPKGSKNKAK